MLTLFLPITPCTAMSNVYITHQKVEKIYFLYLLKGSCLVNVKMFTRHENLSTDIKYYKLLYGDCTIHFAKK